MRVFRVSGKEEKTVRVREDGLGGKVGDEEEER